MRHVIEPISERDFAAHSYGFRPGRGCKDARRTVSKRLEQGYPWVVAADLKSYFDTIPPQQVRERVRQKGSDGRVLGLIQAYLQQPILDDLTQGTPESGPPQGAVLSPLLSNIYLDPLDHRMAAEGYEMVRYADDFVIRCRSEPQAQRALEKGPQWVEEVGLTLPPEKTRIADAIGERGFEFLGYHFKCGQRGPRKQSEQKLRDRLRPKTQRTKGVSLSRIIEDVNRTRHGWFEYFHHAHRSSFPSLDGWVRRRLRRLLRKRRGRTGRGRGSDHQRWPNAYCAPPGRYSLPATRAPRMSVLSTVNR